MAWPSRHEFIHDKPMDEDEERNFFQGQVFEPRLIRDSNCLNSNNRI